MTDLTADLHSVRLGDDGVAVVPRDVGHRMRLQHARHQQVVALLADRRLLGEARRLAVRNSADGGGRSQDRVMVS